MKHFKRIEVVDALRGIALFAIVIIHCFEHYNLYNLPINSPEWLLVLDKGVWNTAWFLFAGKAFSTFSFLFGLSFFIQLNNAEKRGLPFRARFVWRMFLLVLFSQSHSLFYNGDILLLYSCLGLLLVAMCRCSTKTVLIVATIMITQPLEWLRLILNANHIPFLDYGHHWATYAKLANPVMASGNMWEVIQSNITYGQLYGNLWQIEHGRIFQIGGLFLFGMVAGRINLFTNTEKTKMYWRQLIKWAALLFIPFYFIKSYYPTWVNGDKGLLMPLNIAIPSISNFLLMVVLVGLFTLAWYHKGDGYKFQRIFTSYGRMSLTNYITQSIIGVFVFYGFGLGLYKYTGATACLLVAIAIFSVQWGMTNYWKKNHRHGPLEWIWKKLTWMNC